MNSLISLRCHKISVGNGVNVWYREAGSRDKPTILLLHGYPTSSNMFRNLIPLIAASFHVVAPDLPGFGFTTMDEPFSFSFENLANTIADFVRAMQLSKYIIYIFDYGAPVGLRPVSYTHLDVYKRQSFTFTTCN